MAHSSSFEEDVRLDDATVIHVSPISTNDVIEAGAGTLTLSVWSAINIDQINPRSSGIRQTAIFPIHMQITFIPEGLEGRKSFSGHTYYNPSDTEFKMRPIVDAEVKIDRSWRFQHSELTSEQQTKLESAVVTHALYSKLKPESDVSGGLYVIYLAMSDDASKQLDQFLLASSGFTSDLSDNWLRMFYLSLCMMTTTGAGDIMPITSAARILVTVEALCGLILIGFFLNSLAR